jgi:hypothetical protein
MKNKRVIWAVLSLCIIIGLSLVGVVSASDFGPWSIETVDSNGKIGEYTSLELNSMGNPRISYYDQKNNDLKYASWDGAAWKIETVDNSKKVGEYSSLALDSMGNPRISYYDQKNNDLKYASWDGSSWKIETVDNSKKVGEYSSLALDSMGNPRISYYDQKNNDLKYAAWDGSSWKIETVDSCGKVGEFTSLKLDINNDPRIVYYDRINRDLKFAAWNGASWKIETVDNTKRVGAWTSIALDSAGDIHISYYDITNHDLKYAKGTGHAQRNLIAGQLFGQDITQGEYLEKISPWFLVNLTPEAKERLYTTKMEWPNTFDTVTYQSDHATSDADSPIQKSNVFSQVSMSKGAQVIIGTTKLTEKEKFLKSWAKTIALDYTPDWISVETYIQRSDNPYELFVKWENIGIGTNFKEKSKSVETEINAPITKGAFYQGFSVHSAPYDVDLATCYSQPFCTDIRLEFTFDGPYFFNPQSSPLTITPIQQQGGTITPRNPVTVPVGGSQLFTITPTSGYVINDVRVNGVSKGAIHSYQFTDVRSDQTISATFKQIPTSAGWNWATQGWGDWQHTATWGGPEVGENSEYAPVMVNDPIDGIYGEHGTITHLYRGWIEASVWRTFTDPSGSGWNTITFNGAIAASSVPWGRSMTIDVNGQQVFGATNEQTPPGNTAAPFVITASFPETQTATVKISQGQNPAWGPWFLMKFYSVKLSNENTVMMKTESVPFVIPDGSGLVTNATAPQ